MSTSEPSGTRHEGSLGDLVRSLLHEFTQLLQQHVALIKAEVKEEATHWSKVGVLGFLGVMFTQTFFIFAGFVLAAGYWAYLQYGVLWLHG